MFATDYAAQALGIDSAELREALHRGSIQAEREMLRRGDGAVSYQPVSEHGRTFQAIRDGYGSRILLRLVNGNDAAA